MTHRTARRVALGVILVLAGTARVAWLNQNGFGTPYYAAAMRSMTMSWHNLLFAAFDPAGFLAIDKPPVAFWLQAASVSLLGYNGFALHLPQVLEGIAAVALLYHLVCRWHGPVSGLLAALFLAITPISVAVDRSNNTDSCLVLMQLLAAWPLALATERASLPLLLLSAAILGVAFNVKMMAAFLVLPGFIALYAFNAPVGWGRRIAHLAVAAIVLTGVSLSWPLMVDLTPPDQRPYVDSTLGNSELELAIGHNALDRFVRPNWLTRHVLRSPAFERNVPAGPLRLADPRLASQFAWLAPLALAGLWFGRGWRDRCLWGGWALVSGIVFSAAGGIFLPYYVAGMAPPLAALAAIGVVSARGAWRITGVLAASVAWQITIMASDGSIWRDWLIAIPAAAVLVAMVLLLFKRPVMSMAVGVAGLLAAPSIWAGALLFTRGDIARPVARLAGYGARSAPVAPALGDRARLIGFLTANRGDARYAMATTSIQEAAAMIIRTGEPVMALGGYTGSTPILTQTELAQRVAAGDVRYVLIGGNAANNPDSPLDPLLTWVRTAGHAVDPALWRPDIPSGTGAVPQRRGANLAGFALYDLAP